MKFGDDGRLYAINPEAGFFGVAPGTGDDTNPNAIAHARRATASSPTWPLTDDGDVWWEGLSAAARAPHRLEGQRLDARLRRARPPTPTPASPPRRRSARRSPRSGRTRRACRSRRSSSAAAAPPTSRSSPSRFDWEHGVFLGSIMSSETTAAQAGAVGKLRFDPFAMLPVLRLQHGRLLRALARDRRSREGAQLPKLFWVNWFRKGDDGKFLWPGFGENSRVLKWVVERVAGTGEAVDTPIGRVPAADALDTDRARPRRRRPRRAAVGRRRLVAGRGARRSRSTTPPSATRSRPRWPTSSASSTSGSAQ